MRRHPLVILVEIGGVDRRDPVGERCHPEKERVVHPDGIVVVGVVQARDAPPVMEEAADREIDALVYDLYGLTPEEIAVVEAGTAK